MARHEIEVDVACDDQGVSVLLRVCGTPFSPDVLDDICVQAGRTIRRAALGDEPDAVDAGELEDQFADTTVAVKPKKRKGPAT